jgi:hypothetical protein
MGKPLKSKHLNKHKRLREQILSRQGVSAGKRKRLGHSSHFGKVEEIPIERKPSKGAALVEDAAGAGGKKKKSKFNKFKQAAADEDDAPGEKGKEQAPEVENPEKQKKQGIDARLPGESFTKFMKRLNKETQQMLVDQAAKSTHVVEKRRNFLNQRKKERKDKIVARRKGLHKIKEDSENEEDFALSEEQVRASVQAAPKFGEQVDRPPIIRMHKPLKGLLKQPAPDTNRCSPEPVFRSAHPEMHSPYIPL